ncbi:MAG: NAD-dependent protein deacetylase [bacterium]
MSSLAAFIELYPRLVVLTGAGISAASGIPTYRDHDGRWQRNDPIQHGEFIQLPEKRRRYWARSAVGWPAVATARPNRAHLALKQLEKAGIVPLLVTQNVDRLHQHAGHQNVIDLHGRLDRVVCLSCREGEPREQIQVRLLDANPELGQTATALAPDGDAHVEDRFAESLEEPVCLSCGGILMPDVVFFGGTVPTERVDAVNQALEQADGLLVIGSSLMVYSGFRFCNTASQLGLPVAAINQGQTRADEMLSLKLEQDCQSALENLTNQIGLKGP